MTYEEFERKIRIKDLIGKFWNYLISVGVIGVGLFFLYLMNFTDWYERKAITTQNIAPVWAIYALVVFMISLGLYGMWRIPKSYKISWIPSEKSIPEKELVINSLVSDFKLYEHERDEDYRHYKYFGSCNNSFDVYLYWDKGSFYLNAQQNDSGVSGGFIDFGTSRRVTEKFKKNILSYL